MLKYLIWVITLLVLTTHASAQDGNEKIKVKVRISKDDDAKAKLRPVAMIPAGPNVLMMRSGEFDVRAFGTLKTTLDAYDAAKLTHVRSMEVDPELPNGAKLYIEGLVRFGGKALLLGRSKEGNVTMYAQEVDPGLTKASPFLPICKWDTELKMHRQLFVEAGGSSRTPYSVAISPDSMHMLIYSPEIRNSEKEAVYMLAMLDEKLKVLWTRVVKVSELARRSQPMDVRVDDLGDAYVLVKNDRPQEEDRNVDVELFKVNDAGVESVSIKLSEPTYVQSGILCPLKDGRLACVGVYGVTENHKGHTLGNFVTTFAAGSLQLTEPAILSFSTGTGEEEDVDLDDSAEEGGSKAEKRDQRKLAYSTSVIGMLPRNDGGYVIVNEMAYVYLVTTQNGGSYPRWVHGPLLVRGVDAGNKQLWSTTFRRATNSASPILGRVFCAEYDDKPFLFLWDSEEMARRRKTGEKIKVSHSRDPYSAYVVFDDQGKFRVRTVLKGDKDRDYMSGWDMVRVSDSTYYALGTERIAAGRFLPVRIDFSKEAPASGSRRR